MRSGTVFFVTILVLLGLALLGGYLLGRNYATDPMRQVEADAARAWAAAWLPYQVALTAGLGVVGLLLLALGGWAIFLWLRRRALTVYADQHGVMPALLLDPGRPQVLLDAGALAGPLTMGAAGPEYNLPAEQVARLQAGANQGAALTRTMRAWASRDPGQREAAQPAPWALPPAQREYPPLEVLTGDPAHVYRLLEEGHGD